MARYRLSEEGRAATAITERFGADVQGVRVASAFKELDCVCILVDGTTKPEHWGSRFWEPIDPAQVEPNPDLKGVPAIIDEAQTASTKPERGGVRGALPSHKTRKAAELVMKGISVDEVVRITGVHPRGFREYLKRKKIPFYKRPIAARGQVQEAVKLVEQGVPELEAATKSGVKWSSLRTALAMRKKKATNE